MIIYDHHFSHGPFGVCPQFRNEIEDCRFLLVIHKLYILSNSSMKHLPRVSHITNTFHICINHDIKKSMNHQYQSISIIINHHESSIIIIYHICPIVFLFFPGKFRNATALCVFFTRRWPHHGGRIPGGRHSATGPGQERGLGAGARGSQG